MITKENEITRFFANLGLNIKITKPKITAKKNPLARHTVKYLPGQLGEDRLIPLITYYFQDVREAGWNVSVLLSTFNKEGHMDFGICKLCGCMENNACSDPDTGTCFWVADDLCSACATAEQKAAALEKMTKLSSPEQTVEQDTATALRIIENARKFKEAFGSAFGRL